MLELHHRIERKKPDLATMHLNAFTGVVRKYVESGVEELTDIRKSDIIKLVNHGVRACARMDKDNPHERFAFCEIVKGYIAMLTPRELTQIFPIDKTYDGDKWQCKDYYFTMRELEAHGIDNPIGEKVDYILWDYMNHTMMDFHVNLMGAVSDLHREQTGVDPFVSFMRDMGVPAYHMCKDPDTGKEFMLDTESGRTIGIRRPLPRYLELIK